MHGPEVVAKTGALPPTAKISPIPTIHQSFLGYINFLRYLSNISFCFFLSFSLSISLSLSLSFHPHIFTRLLSPKVQPTTITTQINLSLKMSAYSSLSLPSLSQISFLLFLPLSLSFISLTFSVCLSLSLLFFLLSLFPPPIQIVL